MVGEKPMLVGEKSMKENEHILDYVGTWVYNKCGCHFEIRCHNEDKLVLEEKSPFSCAVSELHPVGGGWLEAKLQGGGCVQLLRGAKEGCMFSVWRDSDSSTWSETVVARLFPPREAPSSPQSESTICVGDPPGLCEPARDAETFVDSLLMAYAMTETIAKAKLVQQKMMKFEAPFEDYRQRPPLSCGLWSNASNESCSSEYSMMSSTCLSPPRSNEFGEVFML
jgi:hypothetical protein